MSDLDLDDVIRLDQQATLVCRGYAIEGLLAFLIRATPDGKTVLLGPGLIERRDEVVRCLRAAADLYETKVFD